MNTAEDLLLFSQISSSGLSADFIREDWPEKVCRKSGGSNSELSLWGCGVHCMSESSYRVFNWTMTMVPSTLSLSLKGTKKTVVHQASTSRLQWACQTPNGQLTPFGFRGNRDKSFLNHITPWLTPTPLSCVSTFARDCIPLHYSFKQGCSSGQHL